MQYRTLGSRIPWKVSALGFGAMRLPTIPSPEGMAEGQPINEAETIQMIRYAIDHGVNYLDTAWPYHQGTSEVVVGKALQEGYREKVHLATKCPIWDIQKEDDFEHYLQLQLQRLQTDYLDVYLFHALNHDRFMTVRNLHLLDHMEKARQQGMIRHIGFSFHGTSSMFREIIDAFPWDVAQVQFNYVDTQYQAGLEGIRYAAEKGIGIIVMEPIKGGKLTSLPITAQNRINSYPIKRSSVEWALLYVWNHSEIGLALSGMSSMRMVEENVQYAQQATPSLLNPADLDLLHHVREDFLRSFLIPCTGCGYCLPCPSGVYIPEVFRLCNNLGMGISTDFVFRFYRGLAKTPDTLNALRSNGSAALCIQCGQCVEKCPQMIPIPEEMQKVKAVMDENQPLRSIFPPN